MTSTPSASTPQNPTGTEHQPVPLHGDTDPTRRDHRIQQGIKLRDHGYTWQQIADELGYATRASAFTAIVGHLRVRLDKNVTEFRAHQRLEIQAAKEAIWDKVMAGDPQAILSAVRLWQREANLLGLDAPKQVQVSTGLLSEMEQAFGELRLVVMGEAEDVTEHPETDALEA